MVTVGLMGHLDRGNRDRSRRNPSWFWPALIGVVALAAIVRVAFAISIFSRRLRGDPDLFHMAAAGIASGKGYTLSGSPTAGHPPVFPSLLAVFDLLGLGSVGAQRVALSIVASAGVLLVGLLGRRVAGATVGIVAAVIAALDPLWFQPSGILMSESIYLIAIPGALLVALLCVERPTVWRFGGLGCLIAVAALIRSEAIDFIVFLGVPVVLLAAGDWRKRFQTGLALVAGLLLILTPWLVRNEIRLGGASLSTNEGVTLAGSYCAPTFDPSNPSYGSFNYYCSLIASAHAKPPAGAKPYTELTLDRALTSQTEKFARGHLSAMPGVVVARELTVWGFGNQDFQLDLAVGEGRIRGYEQVGVILYWVLLPFVIFGTVVLARSYWKRLVILSLPFVVVALNSAIFYGSTRARMAAEPSLAVLGSVGVIAAAETVRSWFRRRARA